MTYSFDNWPFDKGQPATLCWISSPKTQVKSVNRLMNLHFKVKSGNSLPNYFSFQFAWGLLPLFQLGYIYVDGNPIGPDKSLIQKNFTLSTHDYYIGRLKPCYTLPYELLYLKALGVSSPEQVLVLKEKEKLYYIPCIEIIRCLYVSKPLYAESLLTTDGLTPYYESLNTLGENNYEIVFNRNFHTSDLYYKNILDFVFFNTNIEMRNWRDSIYTKYAESTILHATLPKFKNLDLIGSGCSIMKANPYNEDEQYEHILILNLRINNIPITNYSISYWHPSISKITTTTQGHRSKQDAAEEYDQINISSTTAPHKGKAKQLESKIQSSHSFSDPASIKQNKYPITSAHMLFQKEEAPEKSLYSTQPAISGGKANPLNITLDEKEYQDFFTEYIDSDFICFCKAIAHFHKLPGYHAIINYGILPSSKTTDATQLSVICQPRRYAYARILSPYCSVIIFELCTKDGDNKSTIIVRNVSNCQATVNTLIESILEDKYWCDKNLSIKFSNNYTPIAHYSKRSAVRWFEIMFSHIRK
jgi:hypothetical protein